MSSAGATDQLTTSQRQAAERATASTLSLTSLDDTNQSWERFASNLMATLVLRSSVALSGLNDGVGYFIFVERPQQYAVRANSSHVIDIDRDVSVPVVGRLTLVGEGANGGVAFEVADQAAALALIDLLNLRDRPSASFYSKEGLVRFYPEGIGNIEGQITTSVPVPKGQFTLETLIETITEFHDRGLCTPQNAGEKFWDDQGAWLPCSLAEKAIQWPLRMALIFAFRPDILVTEEAPNQVGDADFVFYNAHGARSDPPLAVVETKVQKSFRASGSVSPSETAREYVRGLIQTSAYRRAQGSTWGVLVCFDLRKPGEGSDDAWARARVRVERVLSILAGNAPVVVSWLVFADTQAAQAAKVSASLVTQDPLYPVTKRPNYLGALLGTEGV